MEDKTSGLRTVFRDGLFAGKVALVTGGGTGIGLRTAKELAVLGCDQVFIAARKIERLVEAANTVNALFPSPRVFPVLLNIRESDSINAALDAVLGKSHNRLDLLVCPPLPHLPSSVLIPPCLSEKVNNAGGQFPSPAAWIQEKGWKAVIDLNLTGTFLVSQIVFNRVFSVQRSGLFHSISLSPLLTSLFDHNPRSNGKTM